MNLNEDLNLNLDQNLINIFKNINCIIKLFMTLGIILSIKKF